MSVPELLHHRIHKVSHFQVILMDRDQSDTYPDYGHGGSLATFGPQGVAVSTAWDENATVEPDVEITVTGYSAPSDGADLLRPIADGQIAVGKGGVLVGNVITGDLETLPLAEGRYVVTVFADVHEPFTARKVRFHMMRL
jgi:hypothetical protein